MKTICGVIVSSGTPGIKDGHACFNKIPCPIHSKEECKHEDLKLVSVLNNTDKCFKCSEQLVCNEIEIFNQFYEVGAFCNNEKCERFLILVV